MEKLKGIYKHFKGKYYFLEDIAIHSETNEKVYISDIQLGIDTNIQFGR